MRIALLSPYHGGSHRAWAEGLARHSAHRIELLTLPARFWKWRMHGGALTLAQRFREAGPFDALVSTDMLDLSTFLALTRSATAGIPALLYAHENQITYPLPAAGGAGGPMRRQAGERDRHYGFINVASMLAADRVAFNSEFHRRSFLDGARRFLRHFPEHRELGSVASIADRSAVLHVGVETSDLPAPERSGSGEAPPLVLWNQRWEYDKGPRQAFAALQRLAAAGVGFRVAVCGERFGRAPREIEEGIAALGDRVEHVGWLPRAEYVRLLGRADVVLSTAVHEFFGMAVVEAVCAGACPVLPRRLAYPELLPAEFHRHCLYERERQLDEQLTTLLREPDLRCRLGARLGCELRARFSWEMLAPRYDEAFAALGSASAARPRPGS